jgi:Carboxypeptidase regulatory-like domain
MRARPVRSRLSVAIAATVLVLVAPARSAAQPAQTPTRSVEGTVVDASAGVLPGVTVVAMAGDGRLLATTVTNAAGEFAVTGLATDQIALLFHLDGFADAKANVTIGSGPRERLVQRLELAGFNESVTVRADPPPPPPPPPRVLAPVPAHDPASVCGPAKAEGIAPGLGTIKSLRTQATQGLFSAGDEVVIDTGALSLVSVGQNYVARRRYPTTVPETRNQMMIGEHSAGVLQIVEVDEASATAVVIYACDEMRAGDYLAPFEPEPERPADAFGTPAFDKAARLLFADDGKMLGTTRRLLVMAQGSRQGIRAGQRLTIFRRSGFGRGTPVILGEAVVVAVRRDSATIRVERATDVIFLGDTGDWVAPQQADRRNRQ